MKFLIIILLPLIACSNSEPKEKVDSNNISSKGNNKELTTLVYEFQGHWISKSYIERMTTTNSPFLAQKESFKNLYLDTSLIESNYIGVSIYKYGDTETPPTSYYRKVGAKKFQYSHSKFGDALIRDTCQNNCQILEFFNKKGEKVIRFSYSEKVDEFIQISKNCDSHLCELNEFSNKLLLKGSYELLDAKRKTISQKIEIKSNGVVSGCDFEKIQVWTYFRELNGIFEQDVIQIGKANEKLEFYQGKEKNVFYFEVKDNEIILHSLKVDMENYNVKKDKLKYILKRK